MDVSTEIRDTTIPQHGFPVDPVPPVPPVVIFFRPAKKHATSVLAHTE